MAAQIDDFVVPVTAQNYPYTHNCQFTGNERPGLISKAGFRNLLESHIRSLSRTKQISYTRNLEWLNAIRHGSDIPPSGYAGNRASWRNEIGATNPNTSKWIVEGENVYRKSGVAKVSGPMTPTEKLYELMTDVHSLHGHKGRDVFYDLLQTRSGSVKKAFCASFVQVCCEGAERWKAGGNVEYDFKPEVRHRTAHGNVSAAAAPTAAAAAPPMAIDAPLAAFAPMAAMADDVGDNPIVDRQIVGENQTDFESMVRERLLEALLTPKENNFGSESGDVPPGPEPFNRENAVIDPQLFAINLDNYDQNYTEVFQQSPPAQDVQMHDAQEMELERYEFDQYNFDEYNFDQYSFNQYNIDQHSSGQYNYGQHNHDQHNYGQYNHDQYNYGQNNHDQYNYGQNNHDQYNFDQHNIPGQVSISSMTDELRMDFDAGGYA